MPTSDQTTTMHTCFDDPPGLPCAVCDAEFDATPAGIVNRAAEHIEAHADEFASVDKALAALLDSLSDEMLDERAVEVELPLYIPSARWQVCGRVHHGVPRWAAALALARAILGLPNPNAVSEDA